MVIEHGLRDTLVANECDTVHLLDDRTFWNTDPSVRLSASHEFTSSVALGDSSVFLTNADNGCRDTIFFDITVRHSTDSTVVVTACEQYTWYVKDIFVSVDDSIEVGSWTYRNLFGDRRADTVGYQSDVTPPAPLLNAVGCDSLVFLHLTLGVNDTTQHADTVCLSRNSEYYWSARNINYTDLPTDQPLIHLYDTVPDVTDAFSFVGTSWWDAQPFTCDLIHDMNLVLYSDSVVSEANAERVVACDYYIWRGDSITQSDTYFDTLFGGVHGYCDSIYRLDIVIGGNDTVPSENWEVASSCGQYFWTVAGAFYPTDTTTANHWVDGHPAVSSGATDTLYYNEVGAGPVADDGNGNTMQCDLVHVLVLTTYDSVQRIVDTAWCDGGEAFSWFGVTFTASVTADLDGSRADLLDNLVHVRGNMLPNDACPAVYLVRFNLLPVYDNDYHPQTLSGADSILCGIYDWHHHLDPNNPDDITTTQLVYGGTYTYEDLLDTNFTVVSREAHANGLLTANGCDSVEHLIYTYDVDFCDIMINPDVVDSVVCDKVVIASRGAGAHYTNMLTGTEYVATSPLELMVEDRDNYEKGTQLYEVWDTIRGGSNNGVCDSIAHYIVSYYYNINDTVQTAFCDSTNNIHGITGYITHDTLLEYAWMSRRRVVDGVCDSIYYLDVTIHNTKRDTLAPIYACDSLVWGHADFNNVPGSMWDLRTVPPIRCSTNVWYEDIAAGEVVDILVQSNLICDSLVYFSLQLSRHYDTVYVDTSACYAFEWYRNNDLTNRPTIYRNDDNNVLDTVATHTFRFGFERSSVREGDDIGRCDSTVQLTMHIYGNKYGYEELSGCEHVGIEGYTGGWITAADTIVYTYGSKRLPATIANTVACDSVTIHHVRVLHPSRMAYDTMVCERVSDFRGSGFDTVYDYGFHAEDLRPDTIVHLWIHETSGCTDIDTLYIVLLPNGRDTTFADTCDTYYWRSRGRGPYTASVTDQYVTTEALPAHTYERHDGSSLILQCDSISTLILTIRNSMFGTLDTVVCESFTWTDGDGLTYDTNTYDTEHQITRGLPVDGPVTYKYVGGAVNGCDSTATLQLTINHAVRATDRVNRATTRVICDSYEWQGRTFTESSQNTDSVVFEAAAVNGCDSILYLDLVLGHSSDTTIYFDSCQQVDWHLRRWYFENVRGWNPDTAIIHHSGTYTVYLPGTSEYHNVDYCDSTVTAVVTIRHHSLDNVANEFGCDSIEWNGHIYRDSYVADADSLKMILHTIVPEGVPACDSVITLHPTVRRSSPRTDTVMYACGSIRWINQWGDYGYTDSIYLHIDGQDTQYDTVRATNVAGCDSIIYAVLNVLDTRRDTVTTPQYHPDNMSWFCDSVVWRGLVITETGMYADTVHDAATIDGRQLCDSIYVFDAVVHHSSTKDTTIVSTGCDIYTWNNVDYHESTVVDDILPYHNEEGCDSIHRVNLTVRQTTRTVERDTACDTYTWNSERWIRGTRNLNTVAHHSHVDVSVAEFDTITQVYFNAADCESYDTLLLVLYPTDTTVIDTHACELFRWEVSNAQHGTYINESFRDSAYIMHQLVNNTFGCLHFDSLSLAIHTPTIEVLDTTVCDSINWHNAVRLARDTTAFYETGVRDQYGCHINLQITLKVYNTERTIDEQRVCQQYTWEGMAGIGEQPATYTESGRYTDTTVSAHGCDSIVTLVLTIDTNAVASTTYDTVCEGTLYYPWTYRRNGSEITRRIDIVAGQTRYVDNAPWPDLYGNGCDSVAILYLTTNNVMRDTMRVDTCGVYRWRAGNSDSYDHSTIASHTFEGMAANGCDSVVTLILNIGTYETTKRTEYVCDSFIWENRGRVVARYDETNVSGPVYTTTDVTPRQGNCPIVDTLELHIRFASHNVDTVHPYACNSYTWTPFEGFASETFESVMPIATTARTKHRTYSSGCDTTVYLDLHLGYSQVRTDRLPAACDSFYWARGERWFFGNVGGDTVNYRSERNEYGCDTIVAINLAVNHSTQQDLGLREECGEFVFELGRSWDTTFTEEGRIAFSHGVNEEGCPVNYTVDLHLRPNHTITTRETRCQPYTWEVNGQTYIETTTETIHRSHSYAENCDTTYALYLTIGSVTTGTRDTTVCDSVVWRGITYNRPSDETGRFLIIDTIHRDGGLCDSVRRYRLFVNNSQHVYHDTSVCDFYDWRGPHSEDGTFIREQRPGVSTSNGCDSTAYLRFTVLHSTDSNIVVPQACDTFFFSFNGNNYHFTAPIQRDFRIERGNSVGCDSVAHLDLQNVYTRTTGYDSIVELCNDVNPNHPHVWNGAVQTQTHYEMVRTSMLNQYGCDSMSYVHVIVHEPTRGIDYVRYCDNSYQWINGIWYHDDIDGTTPDAPSVTRTDVRGCDSIVYLDLTLEDTIRRSLNVEVCNEYTWREGNGQRYTQSTVRPYPTFAYQRGEGLCDSIVELHLTVHRSSFQPVYVSRCDYYEWPLNHEIYASTGVYPYEYHNEWGCESADTLHLTINPGQNMSDTVIACDSYTWHGRRYTVTAQNEGVAFRDIMHFNEDPTCRHTDTLTLTLYRSSRTSVSAAECSQYTWHRVHRGDTIVRHTGEYAYAYRDNPDAVCPTIETLNVEIMEDYQQTYEVGHLCDEYTFTRYLHEGDGVPLYVFNYPADSYIQEYTVTIENGGPTCTLHDTFQISLGHPSPLTYMRDTACDSYEWWHGNQRAGSFDRSGEYIYTFTNSEGCDSTVTLYLVINHGDTTASDSLVCNTFEWQGRQYNDDHTFVKYYTNADGCGSIDTIHFNVYHSVTGREQRVVCDSLRWEFDGQLYTRSRLITQHGLAANGICDSTVVLDLTVNHNTSRPIYVTGCDSYAWRDHNNFSDVFTTSGVYIGSPYYNSDGCSSTDTLHLTIRHSAHSREAMSVCDTAEWFGSIYTTSGMKVHRDTTADGCNSLDTLDLIILRSHHTVIPAVACDSYTWDEQTFNASDTVTRRYTAANNCDSSVTLQLTINHNTNRVFDTVVCDSVTYRGRYFTASGDYRIDYRTAEGCASFDTIRLTVNTNTNRGYRDTVCDGLDWHDSVYTTSGTHLYRYTSLQTGCASVDTLMLVVNQSVRHHEAIHACDTMIWRDGNVYTASTYGEAVYRLQTSARCDSIIVLDLTMGYTRVNPTPIRREACDVYNWNYSIGHMNGRTFVTDSTGYMNGITTPGTYYARFCTNSMGCDSLLQLNLALGYRDTVEASAAACGQYTYNGITYSNTTTHDSSFWVYRTIRRTFIDGCDSTTHMNITLYPVHNNNPTEYATECDYYQWNGTRYTRTGNYIYEGTTIHGCDSAVRLILVINRSNNRNVIYDTVCERTNWGGRRLTESGQYRDSLHTIDGCDSVITLNLKVYYRSYTSQRRDVCDYYVWPNDNMRDTIRRSTTVWHTTYPEMAGCPNVDTLHLTVRYSSDSIFDRSVCDSVRWLSNSNSRGIYYTRSGIYRYDVPTRNRVGCDSSITMNLTVHPTLRMMTEVTQCQPLVWHGNTYASSTNTVRTLDSLYEDGVRCRIIDTLRFTRTGGDVTIRENSQHACDSFYWTRTNTMYYASARISDTIRNANGCDSNISTLVLVIGSSNSTYTDTVSCRPIVWRGTTYTVSGTYTKTTQGSGDCENVHTLVLHGVYMDTLPDIVACERYTWHGTTYSDGGIHMGVEHLNSMYGCDSNVFQPVRIIKSLRGSLDTLVMAESFYWESHRKTYTRGGRYIDTVDFTPAARCGRIDTLRLSLSTADLPVIGVNQSHTILMVNHYPHGDYGERVDYEEYRWYVDGRLINGSRGSGDTYHNEGHTSLDGHYYYVEVLVDNVWLRSNTVDLRRGVGIDDVESAIDFSFYPNPIRSGSMLNIVVEGEEIVGGATLEFYDLQGRALMSSKVYAAQSTVKVSLPAGVYSVRLTTGDGHKAVRRIVVR